LAQLKDTLYDGLRAIKNTIDDKAVIPGAGAFEIAANKILQEYKNGIKGKKRLGIQAFAEALLVVPKTLGESTHSYSFILNFIQLYILINVLIFFTFFCCKYLKLAFFNDRNLK
jgi:chaperonin GroEL (HSP60 family)